MTIPGGTMNVRALACLVLFCLPLGACEARLSLGAACVLASDCPLPYSCLAGRCRTECRNFRDCTYPMECVALGGESFGCRVGEDATCRGAADCTPPLVCLDGSCEQPCGQVTECAPGLVCDPDHCAQPPTIRSMPGVCDPTSLESGCAAGLRCAFDGSSFGCVADPATEDEVGELCTAQTCGEGLVCAGGRCVAVCRDATPGCTTAACEGTSCGAHRYCGPTAIGMPDGDSPPTLPEGLAYCSELCDVYGDEATDGCPDGTACALDVPTGEFFYWCRPLRTTGLLAMYDDCDADFGGCPFGTLCAVDGAAPARTCRPFCHPGTGAAECDIAGHTGHTCVTVPDVGVGVCGDV